MKTKITFVALQRGKVVRKTIPIEHPDFEVIPMVEFNGHQLPPTSIESQVIEYLDGVDKSDMMAKYDWDVILDYYPYKRKARKNEVEDFINFMRPYVDMFPELRVPIERVMSEAKDVLFGHRKSNRTKAIELLKMVSMTLLSATGAWEVILTMISTTETKKL